MRKVELLPGAPTSLFTFATNRILLAFLGFGMMLIINVLGLAHVKLRSNDAASILLGCIRGDSRDAVIETVPRGDLVPSFWLVSLRPGSSAAQVEEWAGAPLGSSLFAGHQVVVQSLQELGARVNSTSPALSALPYPIHLKLHFGDARLICKASSSNGSSDYVHLIAHASATFASALNENFPAELRMHLRIHSVSPPTIPSSLVSLTLRVSTQRAAHAARWLISQSSTLFLQVRPSFTTHNNNAAWQLQSGVPSALPLWEHGLRGEGQLLSVGDTGIHPYSCFFSPFAPRQRIESTILSGPVAGTCNLHPWLNFSAPSPHPKFHAYLRYAFTDFSDVEGGHGTHVSGSACGSSNHPELLPFNGMAPASKMVFVDLANSLDDLIVPDDLASDYFPCIYESGARISSNSWGSSDNSYDLYAHSLDSFVHSHDDLLVLVAAGNDGIKGEYTVGSPATAKNILAVGAITNSIITDCSQCFLNPKSVYFSVDGVNVTFIPASFGAGVCSMLLATFSLYHPPLLEVDACQEFSASTCDKMRNKAVVLSRGVCFFIDKALRAIVCGAAVVIIENINDDYPIIMDGQGRVVNTPVFSVGRGFPSVAQSIAGPFINSSFLPELQLASFSSLGPTRDGRLKPDIVAPGSPIFSSNAVNAIRSCSSSGVCPSFAAPPNVVARSGTSMATPLVAGVAALIRQYLAEGFYPDGFKGSGPSIYPSAALMRALIIGSSRSILPSGKRSMMAFSQKETPSFAQGWGVPVAAAILPFANSTSSTPSFSIKMIDRCPITAETGLHAQFWVTNEASPLTVTVAWTDPPSLPASDSGSVLVNDIDLLLVSPQGKLYTGNMMFSIQFSPSNVGILMLDSVNNQEHVHVPRAEVGMWTFHARASRLSNSLQLVAAVVAGEGKYVPGVPPDRCSTWCKGTCVSTDTCRCSGSQWGAACDGDVYDIPVQGLYGSYTEAASLAVGGWRFYRFVPSLLGSTLDIFMFSSEGDPDLFVSSDDSSVPDFQHYSLKDQRCDTCGEVRPNEECDPCTDETCRGQAQGCFTAIRFVTRKPVIVGVHVSCCKPSSFTIKFEAQSSESIIVIAASVFLLVTFISFSWYKRQRIAALFRSVGSRWRRSTTRPRLGIVRLPDFPATIKNMFSKRQRTSSVVSASPTRPRSSRMGYFEVDTDASTDEDGTKALEMHA